jgi:hypothetical protein
MDSRNTSAFDIVAELRKVKGFKLAVLGSHQLDAKKVAHDLFDLRREVITGFVGHEPVILLTGCADVGVEKAARLVAKKLTGRLAVVFHRASFTFGAKKAEEMRDGLLAQEADALLIIGKGKVCQAAARLFGTFNKKVFEIELT